MDALVPAFVAALLAGIGDRPARLAALLAARGRSASVIAGMTLGHALAIAVAVAGAMIVAPLMAPNAKMLLLAVALVLAGLGGLGRRKTPEAGHGSAFAAAAIGSFVAGDGTSFLAFALAVKGSSPILAGIGALCGALVLAAVAASTARDWEKLPPTLLGRAAGMLLVGAGLIASLSALRLI